MPFYDYRCLDCQEQFSKILTLREYNKQDVKCPKCGSSKVEQVPSHFNTVTARKS